jgi:3-oxoacyl-[acyl-carrier protein] reductase
LDLAISQQLFVVTGSTSGFGRAIAKLLLSEGAAVILNARGEEKLNSLQAEFPKSAEILAGDITSDATISELIRKIGDRKLNGILINAGGPPASSFIATEMQEWDQAYQTVLRWKVKLTKAILPLMQANDYGRIVYIESASVKQPIENLVLSNSLRLAVVGFVKTLSQEVAKAGITLNVLAPGYHNTSAMKRLFQKKSELSGVTLDQAKEVFENQTMVGSLGEADDLATLAVWLLSPASKYVTGQTITIDGGLVSNTL